MHCTNVLMLIYDKMYRARYVVLPAMSRLHSSIGISLKLTLHCLTSEAHYCFEITIPSLWFTWLLISTLMHLHFAAYRMQFVKTLLSSIKTMTALIHQLWHILCLGFM